MPSNVAVAGGTDRGQVRDNNEDAFCALASAEVVSDLDALLAVADGMGGHRAGEVASQHVAQTLKQLFGSSKYRDWVDYRPDREDYNVLVLKEILEQVNDQLYQMAASRPECHGMGTTATLVLIAGGKAYIGHVGDSRVYLLSKGRLLRLTEDHSWVAEAVKRGELTPEQAAASSRKNQITRALGISSLVRVDRIVQDLEAGDVLLLCTDGLTNMVSDKDIEYCMQKFPDPAQVCQSLIKLANQRGGSDNITVVAARVLRAGQTASLPIPVAMNAAVEHVSGLVTQRLGNSGKNSKSASNGKRMQSAPPVSAESAANNAPTDLPEQVSRQSAPTRKLPRAKRVFQIASAFLILSAYVGIASAINWMVAMLYADDPSLKFASVAISTAIILATSIAVVVGWYAWDSRRS